MDRETLIDAFHDTGGMLEGHFILTSGLHSDRYFQCARLLAHPRLAAACGEAIAAKMPTGITHVISPAMGGLIIGHEVARAIGVPFLFTERVEGKMTLRRFDFPEKARIAVVEDVITSGGSLVEVADLIRVAGGEVVATAAVVDRSGDRELAFGASFYSLLKVEVKTWEPSECPLCTEGCEAVKPGSRYLGPNTPGV
jgi:orotate phosphoribosyltransferase